MKKIDFQNNITKVNKATFDEFQNNIEEASIIVSPTEPTTNEKVWIQKGKNLFRDSLVNGLGNTEYNNGTVIQKTADTHPNPNWKLSIYNNYDYITSPTSFTPSLGRNGFTFVKKSNFNNLQLGVNGSQIDTVIFISVGDLIDGETYAISFNVLNTTQGSISWKDIQIEQGSTATDYEKYIEKKIYCKNDNGVFEEFIPKPEPINIATGVEFETGRIIGGKVEYGKRIDCGNLPNAGEIAIAHGVTFSQLIRFDGLAVAYGSAYIPLPYLETNANSSYNIKLTFDATYIYLKSENDQSVWHGYVTLYYTKD